MESVIIKLTNEHFEKENDMKRLLNYIAAKGRNKQTEILLQINGKGVSLKPEKAVKQMQAVQRTYGKENKRRMYHLIVSFMEDMKDEETIINAAKSIADMLFEKYQVFYGIHISKDNWHIHYGVNAVSYKTGKKWHQSKGEFEGMKKKMGGIISKIC